MNARAARRYRQVDVDSAPKSQILGKLFDRCIRDIDDAEAAIKQNNVAARASAIDHAFRIVTELDAALEHKAAPDLCRNLTTLYDYVLERLSEANAHGNQDALAEARTVVANLGESFRLAEAAK